jgi:hypothetical protein
MTETCQKIIELKYFSKLKFTVIWNVDLCSSVERHLKVGGNCCLSSVAFRHKDHPFGITIFRRDTVSSSGGFHHLSPLHHASPSSLYACLHFKVNQLRLQGCILVSSFRRTNQSLVTSKPPPTVSRLSFAHLHALRLAT